MNIKKSQCTHGKVERSSRYFLFKNDNNILKIYGSFLFIFFNFSIYPLFLTNLVHLYLRWQSNTSIPLVSQNPSCLMSQQQQQQQQQHPQQQLWKGSTTKTSDDAVINFNDLNSVLEEIVSSPDVAEEVVSSPHVALSRYFILF